MRLIDADALKDNLLVKGINSVWDLLKNTPTVDAVPVIRCKDCKYCTQFRVYKDLWYICTKHEVNIDVKAEDFCSYAERGNNETN